MRARLGVGLAAGAVLVAAADTYVVVLALTAIMADVGVPVTELQRATPIVSGFLLGYVVVLPVLGRLSDVVGRRRVLLGCLALLAAGAGVTATASGLPQVVAGRTLQGLGGGGVVPVTLALVADTWPEERRGVPLGVVGAVQEVGSVLGPVVGAGILALGSWRLIFWLTAALSILLGAGLAAGLPRADGHPGGRPDLLGRLLLGVAAVAAGLALAAPGALADDVTWGHLYDPVGGGPGWLTPLSLTALVAAVGALLLGALPRPHVRPAVPVARAVALAPRLDLPGSALAAVVLACLVIAFAAADPSRQVLATNAVVTLPLAAVAAVLFVVRERRAREPLVPLGALGATPAWGALAVNLFVGAALMAALVDVPIFARATVAPDSQVSAALELVRLLVAVPAGALLGGALCARLGNRVVAAAGMVLTAGMLVLMARWGAGAMGERGVVLGVRAPLGGADVDLLLCGAGLGLAIAPVNAAILGAVRADLHGLASALVVVARSVGMLVGLGVLTAVGLHRFRESTAALPSPAVLCPRSPLTCPAFDTLSNAAVLEELHTVFLGAAVCAALAAVLAAGTLRRGARAWV